MLSKELSRVVLNTANAHGLARMEVEWRIGHRQGAFRSGVGSEAWHRLKDTLDNSPTFDQSFLESVEHLGDSTTLKRIQTTDNAPPAWMTKKRIVNQEQDSATTPWTIRASVSVEDHLNELAAANHATTNLKYERHKRRWSYKYRCWRIDLTTVRSNLPYYRDDDDETYEVEVELAEQDMLFERTAEHIIEWGWKIAHELCQLMMSITVPRGVEA